MGDGLQSVDDSPLPPIMVVGNKVDCPPEQRKVSEEEGRALAAEMGPNTKFYETSAKDGTNVVKVGD